jgi:hypothetical protein
MARRILDRKKLRAEATAAEAIGTEESPKKAKSKKAKMIDPLSPGSALVTKVKKVRVKKVKLPPRMRVRWCIYDGGMKPIVLFEYNQLPAAKLKLVELLEKKPSYFLQLFKDLLPMAELEVVT